MSRAAGLKNSATGIFITAALGLESWVGASIALTAHYGILANAAIYIALLFGMYSLVRTLLQDPLFEHPVNGERSV